MLRGLSVPYLAGVSLQRGKLWGDLCAPTSFSSLSSGSQSATLSYRLVHPSLGNLSVPYLAGVSLQLGLGRWRERRGWTFSSLSSGSQSATNFASRETFW